jgi:hypothetical protein
MKPPSKVSWYRFVAVAVLLSCIAGCTVFREKQRISECRVTKADGGSIAIRLNLLSALNISFVTHRIGGYLGVAYTKVFARKWIVEPVIAIGPTFNSLNIAPSKFRFSHISMPLQLNVGFRF